MSSKRHVPAKILAALVLALTSLAVVPLAAGGQTPEEQHAFNEWYYASQENQDYYHWHEWVHSSPENEAYWRWKTEQDRQAQARASHTGSVDGAITAYFGGANTYLGSQARRVAQCESQMSPTAKSPTNDHGLFQINARYHSANFDNVTGSPFYNGVYDPYENAQYARYLYNSQGWGPWTCKP